MTEEQRHPALGPPPFPLGDHHPNSGFPRHPTRNSSNAIPLSETVPTHPREQMNKTTHKTLHAVAEHSKSESAPYVLPKPEQIHKCSSTITSNSAIIESAKSAPHDLFENQSNEASISSTQGKGKRGRPRKHLPKLQLPPLYVFIQNQTDLKK